MMRSMLHSRLITAAFALLGLAAALATADADVGTTAVTGEGTSGIPLANDVGAGTGTFGGDRNTVHVLRADGGAEAATVEDWPPLSKVSVGERLALAIADHGHVLETGRVVMSGEGRALLTDDRIKEAYLGL